MKSRVLLLCALAAACGPKYLPGTEIPDNRDTRAVWESLQTYKAAMNARDAATVLALTSPDYFDAVGTPEPDDDVDRALLEKVLPETLSKVDALKLDFTIRNIEIRQDRAVAQIFYDSWYRVKTAERVVPKRDSDLQQVLFHKVGDRWYITSGL